MIGEAGLLLVELVGLFFGAAFAIHLLQRRIGPDRVRAWMGGRPVVSALKGIAVGFLTPFCTYSAIPLLVGLRQAGAPPAGYVAFISAAPVLDPVLFGALVVIVGPPAALLYATVAFAASLTLALTAQRLGIERHLRPLPVRSGPAPVDRRATVDANLGPPRRSGSPGAGDGADQPGCGSVDVRPWQGTAREAGPAARAAIELLGSVAPLLVAGVAVGLLIETAIPPTAVASITGDNGVWSIPVAAAVGTPLYVHTSLFVPIANSLTNAGVGIGAIVALTISGAGANVPEFIILARLAGPRLIGFFLAYVFAVAVTGGLIADALLG